MGTEESKPSVINITSKETQRLDREFMYFLNLRKAVRSSYNPFYKSLDLGLDSEKSRIDYGSIKNLKNNSIIETSQKLLIQFLPALLSKNTNLHLFESLMTPSFAEFDYNQEDSIKDEMVEKVEEIKTQLINKTKDNFFRISTKESRLTQIVKEYLKQYQRDLQIKTSRFEKSTIENLSTISHNASFTEKTFRTIKTKTIYQPTLNDETVTNPNEVSTYNILIPVIKKQVKPLIYDAEAIKAKEKEKRLIERSRTKSKDGIFIPNKGVPTKVKGKNNASSITKLLKVSAIITKPIRNNVKSTGKVESLSKSILGGNRMDYSNYIQGVPINFKGSLVYNEEDKRNYSTSNNVVNNYNIKISQLMINNKYESNKGQKKSK